MQKDYLQKLLILVMAITLSVFIASAPAGSDEPMKRGKLVFFTPPDISGLTPEEVMEKAARLADKGDKTQAIEILKEHLKKHPDGKFAPEIHFRIGKLYLDKNNYNKAYTILEKVFIDHPNISNPDRVLEALFRIADVLYDGKRRNIAGIPLGKQYSKAIKIYERIISHAPFGQYADDSQFRIGKTYMLMDKDQDAIKAFKTLEKDYPDSTHLEEALFLIASNHDSLSKASDYDQQNTEKAIEKYRKFLQSYPESTYHEKAQKRLAVLLDRKGKEIFQIAKFYFDRKKYQAAKVYFNSLIEEYSMTQWAEKSTQYLTRIELKENENKKDPS